LFTKYFLKTGMNIMGSVIRQELEGKMTSEIATLLDGGDIFSMDATEISKAITSINEAYKTLEIENKYFGGELNLLAIFQKK